MYGIIYKYLFNILTQLDRESKKVEIKISTELMFNSYCRPDSITLDDKIEVVSSYLYIGQILNMSGYKKENVYRCKTWPLNVNATTNLIHSNKYAALYTRYSIILGEVEYVGDKYDEVGENIIVKRLKLKWTGRSIVLEW